MISAFSVSYLQSLPLPPHSTLSHRSSPSSVSLRQPRVSASFASTAERTRSASSTCVPPPPPKLASISFSSFYEVLGLRAGASSQEIKAAYRRLARTCHPDVAAIDRKNSSADEFMKIHTAYSTLSDPEKRADYDRRLFQRHRSYSVASRTSTLSRFPGFTGRNWETDQCW